MTIHLRSSLDLLYARSLSSTSSTIREIQTTTTRGEHEARQNRRALHQYHPHAGDGRRAAGRCPVIPERRWPWRRWVTCCGNASCDSIRQTRSGPTATASCCRPGTRRCCCIRCCIWRQVKAVNRQYEIPGEPSVTLDDIKRFRQLDSKCPGHPEYRWTSGVETTTGPLGQGAANSVGMAIGRSLDGERLQPPRLRDVQLPRLCPVGRRLHDGRDLQRGRLAGRAPQARQPVLDLRQQPHHDRGEDRPGLQRGRGHAFRGAMAGTSCTSPMPTTWKCSSRRSMRRRIRPIGRR